jgi:5-aminolevulinate synthase
VSEREGLMDRIDLIEGTLGKAYGVHGRLYHRQPAMCDFVRSFASGLHLHHRPAAGRGRGGAAPRSRISSNRDRARRPAPQVAKLRAELDGAASRIWTIPATSSR